jgi:hypothetical protein
MPKTITIHFCKATTCVYLLEHCTIGIMFGRGLVRYVSFAAKIIAKQKKLTSLSKC